ncbi:MAG: winged helix-turn-helix transcriptional regulator [archaeon]|nr:winged helix-turn-helix transcriptional regulator [archaeon]MCP8320955.1 winged helix-turn-helix transcriptional regulator [archaeon]
MKNMPEEVRYKDMGDSLLLKAFGYSPKLRILDIFLTNPYFDFSKEELVKELGMSKQTLYKNFKDLEELEVVKISRKIGRATLYKINKENPLVKKLDEAVTEVSLQIAEREAKKQAQAVPISRD